MAYHSSTNAMQKRLKDSHTLDDWVRVLWDKVIFSMPGSGSRHNWGGPCTVQHNDAFDTNRRIYATNYTDVSLQP